MKVAEFEEVRQCYSVNVVRVTEDPERVANLQALARGLSAAEHSTFMTELVAKYHDTNAQDTPSRTR
ncbi:hypothetical protein SK128_024864 [Halocaridina rubra]|uniref:Uncharacterized protein n=1 Tax=Halocaridina rubra TaxID=373956 RepID=A0AAN9AGV4_HALRR